MAGYGIQGTNTSPESDQEVNLQLSPQRKIPETQAMSDGGSGLQDQQSGEVREAENQDPALPDKRHGECSSSAVEIEKCDVQSSPEECGHRDSPGFSQTERVAHLEATDTTEGLQVTSIKLSEVGSVLEPSAGKSASPEPASLSGSVVDLSSQAAECIQGDSQGLSQETHAEHRVATATGEGLQEANINLPEGSVVEPPPPKSARSKSDSQSCNVEESGSQTTEYSQGNRQGSVLPAACVEHPVATAMNEGLREVNKLPEAVSIVETSPLNSQSSSVKDSESQASWSYGDKKLPEAVSAEHLAVTRAILQAARNKLSERDSVLETSLHQSAPLESTSQPANAEKTSLQAGECSRGDSQGLSHTGVEHLVATTTKEGPQKASIQISETAYAENLVGTAIEGLQEASIQISETAYAENLVGTAMMEGIEEASIQMSETAENRVGAATMEGLEEVVIKLSKEISQAAGCDGAASQGLPPTVYAEHLEGAAIRDQLKQASIKLLEATSLLKTSIKLLEATSVLETSPQYTQSSRVEDSGLQTPGSAVSNTDTVTEAEENPDSVRRDQFRLECSSNVVEQEKCDVGIPPAECVQTDDLGVSETVYAEHLVGTAAREGLHEASIEVFEVASALQTLVPSSNSGSAEDSDSQASGCSQGVSEDFSRAAYAEYLAATATRELLQAASNKLSKSGSIMEPFPQKYAPSESTSLSGSGEDTGARVSECSQGDSHELSPTVYAEHLADAVIREGLQAASITVSEAVYAEHLADAAMRGGLEAARIKLSELGSVVEQSLQESAPAESSSQSGGVDPSSQAVGCSQGDNQGLSQMTVCADLVATVMKEGLQEADLKLPEAGSVLEKSSQHSSHSGSLENSESEAAEYRQGDNQGLSQTVYAEHLVATTTREELQEGIKLSDVGSVVEPSPPKSASSESTSLPGSAEDSCPQTLGTVSHKTTAGQPECDQGDSPMLSQTASGEHFEPTATELLCVANKLPEASSVLELEPPELPTAHTDSCTASEATPATESQGAIAPQHSSGDTSHDVCHSSHSETGEILLASSVGELVTPMAGYQIPGTNISSESDQENSHELPPQRIISETQAMFDGSSGIHNQQFGEVGGVGENQDPISPDQSHGECSSSAVEHERCDVQRSPEECCQRGSLVFSQTATDMTEGPQAASIKLSEVGSVLQSSGTPESASLSGNVVDSSSQAAEFSQGDRQVLSHTCVEHLVATATKEGLQEASIQISETAYTQNLVGTAMMEGVQEASIQISETAYTQNLVGTAMREGLQEASIQISETAYAENLVGTAMREGLQEASIRISETAYAENLVGTALMKGQQEASIQMSEIEYAEHLVATATSEGLQGLQEAVIKLSESSQAARCDEAASQELSPTSYAEHLEGRASRDQLKQASMKLLEAASHLKTSIKLLEAKSLLETSPQNSQSSSEEDSGSQTPDSAVPHKDTMTVADENKGYALIDQFCVDCSSSLVEQDKCVAACPLAEYFQADDTGVSEPGSEDSSSQAAKSSQGNSQGLSQMTACVEHLVGIVMPGLREARATLSAVCSGLETSPPSSNSGSAEDSDSQASESSHEVSGDFSGAAYAEYLAARTTRGLLQAASTKVTERGSILEPFPQKSATLESDSQSCSEDSDSQVSDCSQEDSPELSQTAYADNRVYVEVREGLQEARIRLSESTYVQLLIGASIRQRLEAVTIKLSEIDSVVEPSLQESAPAKSSSQSGSADSNSQAAESSQTVSQGLSEMTACLDLVTIAMKGLHEARMKLLRAGPVLDKYPQHSSHSGSVENSRSQVAEYSHGDKGLSQRVYAEHLVATNTRKELQEGIIKLPDVSSVVEPSAQSALSESTSLSGSAEDCLQTLDTVSHKTTVGQPECDQGDSPMLSQTASGEHFEPTATELLCVANTLTEAISVLELETPELPTAHTHSCTPSEATPAIESHGAIAPQHSPSDKRYDIAHNSHSESDESE